MRDKLVLENALLDTACYAETSMGLARLLMSLRDNTEDYQAASKCTDKIEAHAIIVHEAIRLAPVMEALLQYAEMICNKIDESLRKLGELADE